MSGLRQVCWRGRWRWDGRKRKSRPWGVRKRRWVLYRNRFMPNRSIQRSIVELTFFVFCFWRFEDESSRAKSGCVACRYAASVFSCLSGHKLTVSTQSRAESHLTIHKSSPMSASVMPLSSSSSSPPTTMFLSQCVSPLPFHPILTLSKVKRKNDNTVLKYGSSLHLFFSFVCKPLSSRGSKSHGMSPI